MSLAMIHFLADATSPVNFLDYLSRASIITFLIVVVYGGYKKMWIWGWLYNEKATECDRIRDDLERMREEKDAWRETALKSANVATQAFEEIRKKP